MKLDELISFDSLINDALEDESPHINTYNELYPLFSKNLVTHYESYKNNEDLPGIIKFIFSSQSKQFLQTRSRILTHPVLESTQKGKRTRARNRAIMRARSASAQRINHVLDYLFPNKPFQDVYEDQEELFYVIDHIYDSLPKDDFQMNMSLSSIEEKLTRNFDKLSPGLIFKICNKLFEKQDGVSFETLVKLEKQFLNGKITDLYPNQIADLMKICNQSDCSKILV